LSVVVSPPPLPAVDDDDVFASPAVFDESIVCFSFFPSPESLMSREEEEEEAALRGGRESGECPWMGRRLGEGEIIIVEWSSRSFSLKEDDDEDEEEEEEEEGESLLDSSLTKKISSDERFEESETRTCF